jgi:SAM-dependent methyltransferase
LDIMNELPQEQFEKIDDLLAFVSIYDDDERTSAYKKLLKKNQNIIRGKVCVEAGCGFGWMAEEMAKLGAHKVYAVEANDHLYNIAKARLQPFENVHVVHSDIQSFVPEEHISVLVHEFFGQLLFDEDIFVLDQLKFSPDHILPNKALLKMGTLSSFCFIDDVVTLDVLKELKGALVSGLFDADEIIPETTIMEWQPGLESYSAVITLPESKADLLCFGLEIYHDDYFVCRAEECENWSYTWTPRGGNKFKFEFKASERGADVFFHWIT